MLLERSNGGVGLCTGALLALTMKAVVRTFIDSHTVSISELEIAMSKSAAALLVIADFSP